MMYPFMTFNDNMEIVHSEMKDDGRVLVHIEKPDDKACFKSADCWLPEYKWENIHVFSGAWGIRCGINLNQKIRSI